MELMNISREFAPFVLDVVYVHGNLEPANRQPILFLSLEDFVTSGEHWRYEGKGSIIQGCIEEAMKKCVFCANEIQDEAIVCQYCGRDQRVTSQQQDADTIKASSDASTALTLAIIGIFCFGIVLEPLALIKAGSAKKVLQPTDPGYGNAISAQIIAWIAFVLWALSIIIVLISTLTLITTSY